MGALKEVSATPDRAECFAPDLELRALVTGFLRTKVQPHLAAGADRLSALKAHARAIKDATPEERKARNARLDKLGTWHRRGQAVIPLLTKFFGQALWATPVWAFNLFGSAPVASHRKRRGEAVGFIARRR